MSVSSNFKNAVAEHNLPDIRGGLWSCILVDPTMTGKFKESLEYAIMNGISESELYEADDDEMFDATPTQENFNNLSGMIRLNFSKKKIETLCDIGRTLYPPKTSTHEELQPKSVDSDNGRSPQQKNQTTSARATIGGTVSGATAGAIIGKIALGGTIAILGGAVLGAAVGALVGTAISKKN